MRALFMAIVICVICSCAGSVPYMDLRYPIYMVTSKSFLIGCDNNNAESLEACRTYRLRQIQAGVKQWFKYFDSSARPQVIIVRSDEELPSHLVNKVIYLMVNAHDCGMATRTEIAAACYNWGWFFSPRMKFRSPGIFRPSMVAHELGHAFGLDDNDVPAGTFSVMSYTHPSAVLPIDIKMMCRLHHECRMVRRKFSNN